MKNKGCSLSGPPMLKAKSSENFQKYKNLLNFGLLGALEIRGMKSCDFYRKRHTLAWIHVVWAIFRQNRLGIWPPGWAGKNHRACATAQPVIRYVCLWTSFYSDDICCLLCCRRMGRDLHRSSKAFSLRSLSEQQNRPMTTIQIALT